MKKIIIIIFIFILFLPLSYFLVKYFYFQEAQKEISIKYIKPSSERLVLGLSGRVSFSFKYPIPKEYFLENFKSFPILEGDFVFKRSSKSPLAVVGYQEIEFLPRNIERDKAYQIKVFDKEFNFSLPSPKIQKLEFDPQKKEIELVFFEPVDENYVLKNFRMEPFVKGEYYFLDEHKRVVFKPEKIEEDKDYKVIISDKDLSFKIESPKVKDFSYNDDLKQLEITFTKSITQEFFFANFVLNPSLGGEYIFAEDNTKVIFKTNNIVEDQLYNVKLLGRDFTFQSKSVKVKKIYFDKTKKQVVINFTKSIEKGKFFENFKIEPYTEGQFIFNATATQVIFKPNSIIENQDYFVTILGATLSFKYIPPPPPPPPPPVPLTGNKHIDINLSTQRLRLYQAGILIAEYPISSGRPGMATPTGNFQVLSKKLNHWSVQYSLYMPYAMKFYNGYYIHELPYWPGGYREGEEHLGIPVSHGCVRLGIGAAASVYNFADIGTPIVIHY